MTFRTDNNTGLSGKIRPALYIGLYAWLAIVHATAQPVISWNHFLLFLGVQLLAMMPLLLFTLVAGGQLHTLSKRSYRLLWWICFAGYLPLLILLTSLWMNTKGIYYQVILNAALFSPLLELLLLINDAYRKKIKQLQWLKGISIEKAIFIIILIISLVLAVMAVSSTGDPAYDTAGKLLIGFEFKPAKLFRELGSFLGFALQFLIMYGCGYFFFYVNSKILVPKLLKSGGLVLYILGGLALTGLSYPLIAEILFRLPVNARLGYVFSADPFKAENAFAAISILALSLPLLLSLQWSKQNNRILSLEKEQAAAELSLLKQQLNPHFFFNTLNNLYALSLQQSKQTPESILQLSDLMRYVIYRAQEPVVDIGEEVQYLKDYIQLQQIRLKRQPDLQFDQQIGADTPQVAPLLLIVLVENAFKHGIEPSDTASFLHLQLITDEKKLQFICINSTADGQAATGGIGLQNLRRRLELLYPGKHRLNSLKENHTFKAVLELDLI